MRVAPFALALVGALLLGALLAPAGAGHHCVPRMVAYGRPADTPVTAPPYLPVGPRCSEGIPPAYDPHELPPETGEIMIRVHGDFGSGFPSLLVTLDGFGFQSETAYLTRTPSVSGEHYYRLDDWLRLPVAPAEGELKVKAGYHGSSYVVTFRAATMPSA